ncbi:MAG TPA: IclR family transcriptional regulator C-terminal domain-containing protein [Candidatus Competibacteraceae bacterium]|nr:IclR family transcriptional regulator C-terminal domain-containing protein [Candidatus Competibacteraceae bacterium]
MDNVVKTLPRKRGRPAGSRSQPQSGQSQSLSRGLQLLERLAEARHGISLVDLAQQVGMAPSTTHRLLTTLEQAGFIQQDEELGRWFVGVKAFTLGNAFLDHCDFVARARPYMHRLMEQAGETVNLAVLDGNEAVFLAQVECREMMRMIVKLGSRAPLHASGVGKALLATMSEEDIAAVLHRRGLPRYTDNTITTPGELREELARIRRQGFARDDEEHAVGLRCMAATLHDHQGKALAAISLSGPRARIPDDRMLALGAMVAATAGEITAALGGQRPARDER